MILTNWKKGEKMKKKIFLLFLCIIFDYSQKTCFTRNLDLIMILDSGFAESIYNPYSGGEILNLSVALNQQAGPIVVSGVILNNFLIKLADNATRIKYGWPSNIFDLTNFQVFKCVNEDLYLIIPNKYALELEKTNPTLASNLKESLNVTDEELTLGLKINTKELFKRISDFSQLKEELRQRWTGWREQIGRLIRSGISSIKKHPREINISKIKDMFISGPKVKGQNFASWNIYLRGHGSFANRNKNLHRIVGLLFSDMIDLLDFFNDQVDTNCLYYSTCFGGGRNADLINKHFLGRKQDTNYIIVSGASTDAYTHSSNIKPPQIKDYFTDLHKIFSGKITNVESLKQALKKISPLIQGDPEDFNDISSIPIVRIPGMHSFSAVKIANNIKIITTSQDNPLNLLTTNRLLIYEKDINFLLDKFSNPTILSMVPRNGFVHRFKKINGFILLENFLANSIFALKESINKNFIFDELKFYSQKIPGLPHGQLNAIDVIIEKSFKTRKGAIKTAGLIYFKTKINDDQFVAYKGVWLERSWQRQGHLWAPTVQWQRISTDIVDKKKQLLLNQQFEPFKYECWEEYFEPYLRSRYQLPIVQ
jgi:hypothetical protein